VEIILGSDKTLTTIKIPFWLWAGVIFDLRRRGGGVRESGAFLLGRDDKDPARVSTYICHDDVDADAYQHGAIAFHASGSAALWRLCKEKNLQLLIEVHTHPGHDVRQSSIDERHPMMPIADHTAMIVPNFANIPWWSLKAVGVYEYLGGFRWRTHAASAPNRRVKLSLW
jgi:proteasome lid subunit RPN8/RPN11